MQFVYFKTTKLNIKVITSIILGMKLVDLVYIFLKIQISMQDFFQNNQYIPKIVLS